LRLDVWKGDEIWRFLLRIEEEFEALNAVLEGLYLETPFGRGAIALICDL